MYSFVTDKKYLALMRQTCGEMMQELCHVLKEEYDIGAVPKLIGSGARRLITQNGKGTIDLDYNLEINRCDDYGNCRNIKEAVRKSFNIVLKNHKLDDCSDSTSCLETGGIYFTDYPEMPHFSIDVAIVSRDEKGNYYRLKHMKTGRYSTDNYYWNQAPNSHNVKKKSEYIIRMGKWDMIAKKYLALKNMYLCRNDYDHPSFICYIEAVNNVFDELHKRCP